MEEMTSLSILYAQKHRHYHDITHIQTCLALLEEFDYATDISNRHVGLIESALWYHDAIYNPYSKENESVSRLLFLTEGRASRIDSGIIASAISATANHTETQTFRRDMPIDEDYALVAQVVLDIDLAGFGMSWDVYTRNGDNIRKEYYLTNDKDFYAGRLAFLQKMQARIDETDIIYYTDYFRNKYYDQAKINIADDIAKTKSIVKYFE
jgi:predicted metal-dependent HD superfamily phosphohydrolase